jgi:hypothetical protein
MIMVSLVLKLFVSSRPLKLEGVLCIYVLLFHEGQAETICYVFLYDLNTRLTFIVLFSWSFVCVLFHVITRLLSFFYQDYIFHAHVLSSFDPSTHLGLTKNESQWFSGYLVRPPGFSSHCRHGYVPAERIHVRIPGHTGRILGSYLHDIFQSRHSSFVAMTQLENHMSQPCLTDPVYKIFGLFNLDQ